ncbi:AAA family ATPase [Sorangium sp. So ce513]|uniref:AAA family ATPase n=1 Tax=Sorangium sp. So ce513 TaxID=3133315 RepID=UPI003F6315BB
MSIQVPIGIDNFRRLRELGLEYVDKSHLIQELLDRPGTEVVLFPRPWRFGKTLNLSMLRCFFERSPEDLSPLFRDLRIWQAGEPYRAHFQRYPVLHLTFKGLKADGLDVFWEGIHDRIARLFDEHRDLLDGSTLSEREARRYRAVLDGTAGRVAYETALLDLSSYLHRRHGERVVILIDEYDEPLHAAYVHGHAAQVIGFFRAFLTEGLKGNPHLFKAVLTGVLRVARESIFSGLNNVAVYSLLAPEFDTCFGFTEPEVEALLARSGQPRGPGRVHDDLPAVARRAPRAAERRARPAPRRAARGRRGALRGAAPGVRDRRAVVPRRRAARPRAGDPGLRAGAPGGAGAGVPGALEPRVGARAA